MRKKSHIALLVVLAAVLGSGLLVRGAAAVGAQEITVVGTVIETDWDDDGNVTAIDLVADDGNYAIDLSGRGSELLGHVGETVEIAGSISEDEGGWTTLLVASYTVLQETES
jgi:hypothetical protein